MATAMMKHMAVWSTAACLAPSMFMTISTVMTATETSLDGALGTRASRYSVKEMIYMAIPSPVKMLMMVKMPARRWPPKVATWVYCPPLNRAVPPTMIWGMAVIMHRSPAMTKARLTLRPVMPMAVPVMAMMPAPMIWPTAMDTRSILLRLRFSSVPEAACCVLISVPPLWR